MNETTPFSYFFKRSRCQSRQDVIAIAAVKNSFHVHKLLMCFITIRAIAIVELTHSVNLPNFRR